MFYKVVFIVQRKHYKKNKGINDLSTLLGAKPEIRKLVAKLDAA